MTSLQIVIIAIGSVVLLAGPVAAEPCDPTKRIVLLQANDQGALELSSTPGDSVSALDFHFHGSAPKELGQFVASPLLPVGSGGSATAASVSERPNVNLKALPCGGTDASVHGCIAVALDREWINLQLSVTGAAAATKYVGQLHFISGAFARTWPISVQTSQRGIISVEKLPAMSLENGILHPFKRLLGPLPDQLAAARQYISTRFSPWINDFINVIYPNTLSPQLRIVLRDATGSGPYQGVRARLAAPSTEAASETSEPIPQHALSFWTCPPANGGFADSPAGCEQKEIDFLGSPNQPHGVMVGARGQTTVFAHLRELPPAEYRGLLRFDSADTVSDDERSRLDLTLQVRDHWFFAVMLMIGGSIIGWVGRVYLPGRRTRRSTLQCIRQLRARSSPLSENAQDGRRRLPHESGSVALTRANTLLALAATAASFVPRFVLLQKEIDGHIQEAKLRIDALEEYRNTRNRLQPHADLWWAAHWHLGRELRSVLAILDESSFDAEMLKAVTSRLQELVNSWTATGAGDKPIREALAAREGALEDDLSLTGPLPDDDVGSVGNLHRDLTAIDLSKPYQPLDLRTKDALLARLAFVWRFRNRPWLSKELLPVLDKKSLEELYAAADENLWTDWTDASLGTAMATGRLVACGTRRPEAFQIVECELRFGPDFEQFLSLHPARVHWRFTRLLRRYRAETDRPRAVQFFPGWGNVAARATLRWNHRSIVVGENPSLLRVRSNPLNRGVIFTELMFVIIALGFAVVTGLVTNYGPTFGTFKQYVALFLWAAGVSAGGNMFFVRGGENGIGGDPMGPKS